MPALETAKFEKFAIARAQGMSRTRAAVAAGYSVTRADSQGSVLSKRPEIIARIAELVAGVSQGSWSEVAITKDYVLQGIAETIELARAANKFSDMLKGYQLLGDHLHLFDKEVEGRGFNFDVAAWTDDELKAFEQGLIRAGYVTQEQAAQYKHNAQLEAGQQVIDVTPEPAAQEEGGW